LGYIRKISPFIGILISICEVGNALPSSRIDSLYVGVFENE
jgi:hypothetical protein